MKLKNKKTGEIGELQITEKHYAVVVGNGTANCYVKMYSSLADLNEDWEDWEDYEEPKEYWYINPEGKVYVADDSLEGTKASKEIGNYFETKEEAEKAVEKLKAWKRLKDKGFRFIKDWVYRYDMPKVENHTYFEFVAICEDGALFDDLDLLFGGEE